ncbi:hypothetical protein E0G79_22775 [Salmonella enterica]|nr:hypothetical protein [Salmonella enterica]
MKGYLSPRIWLVAGITDIRNGFNGFASKAQNVLKDDPLSGHLFIFRGCRGGVKRRGVVSPPLATFPHSSIDKPADQFQDSDYSVRHCNNRPQNDD